MILSGITDKAALRMARSRNRAVIGRKTGSIIDIYMCKGQCIARLWPVDQLYEPTPQYLRTHEAVIREREIEKWLSLDDVLALKYRAVQSRYNWWEVLGRIHLSREFHSPGTTCGTRLVHIRRLASTWEVRMQHDRPCFARILLLGKKDDNKVGHYWIDNKHREAGLENTLRGQEVINPSHTIDRAVWVSETKTSIFVFSTGVFAEYTRFIIQTFDIETHETMTGESGLYMLTADKPWYLECPIALG